MDWTPRNEWRESLVSGGRIRFYIISIQDALFDEWIKPVAIEWDRTWMTSYPAQTAFYVSSDPGTLEHVRRVLREHGYSTPSARQDAVIRSNNYLLAQGK